MVNYFLDLNKITLKDIECLESANQTDNIVIFARSNESIPINIHVELNKIPIPIKFCIVDDDSLLPYYIGLNIGANPQNSINNFLTDMNIPAPLKSELKINNSKKRTPQKRVKKDIKATGKEIIKEEQESSIISQMNPSKSKKYNGPKKGNPFATENDEKMFKTLLSFDNSIKVTDTLINKIAKAIYSTNNVNEALEVLYKELDSNIVKQLPSQMNLLASYVKNGAFKKVSKVIEIE